jgi:hypothetical protein
VETGILHGVREQILDGLMELLEFLRNFEEAKDRWTKEVEV